MMKFKPLSSLKYLVLAVGALTTIFPFIWMLSTSLKSPLEVLSTQISLVPTLKKYLVVEGGEDQVEFAWLTKAERILTEAEGRFVAAGDERAAAAGIDKARKELPTLFGKNRTREEISSELLAAWDATSSRILADPGNQDLRDALKRVREELVGLNRSADYSPEAVEMIFLTGERRGKTTTVPPERIVWRRLLWSNYLKAWLSAPFGRYFFNSIVMSLGVTLGQVLTSALAAYAFARMRFRGKEILFMILLGTMMVPKQVILIPDYAILSSLHWINTYYVLIVPFIAAVFGIYFLRQHFETLPQDLFDAASLDGCGQMRTLFQIVLPLSRGVLITVSIFTFIMTWNSLLWPLVMTNTPEMRPLQVGLAVFNQESGTDWELLMSASTFSIAPLLAIFFIAQKQFIEGITRSGMKD